MYLIKKTHKICLKKERALIERRRMLEEVRKQTDMTGQLSFQGLIDYLRNDFVPTNPFTRQEFRR